MAVDFPEITSFGTLLKFALALEQTTADLEARAAEAPVCAAHQGELTSMADKHTRRIADLERLQRERLNEVILQPLGGMARDEYLPPTALPVGADAAGLTRALADLEDLSARFYGDAAERAVNLLGGLDRTFKRFVKEDRKRAQTLRQLG
ncbi:MAG: hypothetical protein ABI333_25555 [bacterium]